MLTNHKKEIYCLVLGVPVDYPNINKYNSLPTSVQREWAIIPLEKSFTGTPFSGGFFVYGTMANKRMISRDLKKSRRLARLFEIAGELGEFALNLYCIGIPHHDELGLITADPFDWKVAIHPLSDRSIDDFFIALECLEQCGLFKKSKCRKVFQYYNHEAIQNYRNDRNLYTEYPEIKEFFKIKHDKP